MVHGIRENDHTPTLRTSGTRAHCAQGAAERGKGTPAASGAFLSGA